MNFEMEAIRHLLGQNTVRIIEELSHDQFGNEILARIIRTAKAIASNGGNINRWSILASIPSHGIDFKKIENTISKASEEPTVDVETCIRQVKLGYYKRELERVSRLLKQASTEDFPNKNEINNLILHLMEVGTEDSGKSKSKKIELFGEAPVIETSSEFLNKRFKIYRKNLTVIAGAPKNMKTSFVSFMSMKLVENKNKVIVFPVDSSPREWAINMISARSGVDRSKIMQSSVTDIKPYGELTKQEFELVMKHKSEIEQLIESDVLIIDESSTLPEISLKARLLKPDVIIIDLINSVVLPNVELGGGTEASVTPIVANHLKLLAKQLNCAIVCTAWLHTTRRRPYISDLYGSKAMEKWAARVLLLYYSYSYNKIPAFREILEVIDGASRFGESKIYPIKVIPETCYFSEPDFPDQVKAMYMNYTNLTVSAWE